MREHEAPGDSDAESGMFPVAQGEAARALRERAQDEARRRAAQIPEDFHGLTPDAGRKLLHELRVHQIELELQNEELRSSQDALEVSRARYFDLYELAPVGYVTVGEQGLVQEANLTAAVLLGVARSALVKQPWTRFVCPEDQDAYFVFRRQLLASGALRRCELRLLKSDGEAFWVSLEARLAPSEGGTRASRIVLSDISERKRAADALRTSEARLSMLFESSPAALMTLAPPSWRFTSGNAAAILMFGARNEADFTARTPWHYSREHQPDGSLSTEKGAALLEEAMLGRLHAFEWTFLRDPASEFCGTVELVRLEVNGTALLQATVRDDSEAQKQRGIAVQTERLASMGLLAASVGHEINNPLAYVLSNVQSLSQVLPRVSAVAERCRVGLEDAVGGAAFAKIVGEDAALLDPAALLEANEHARDALQGVQRIAGISKVLSAFSRVETSDLAPVDLVVAIECAFAMAFNELRFRTKLVKDLNPVPAVWGSEGKLSQVFLNLLINAAHAIDAGKTEDNCITVRTWAGDGNVFAEVKDTGRGISPENLPQIFEPFFSTRGVGQGSGLGLSICRNILAEFGGEIQAESEVGKGARFLVRLPVCGKAADVRGPFPLAAAAELPTVRGRVLIIDDEAPLRVVMKRLLSEHEVITAASGGEAQALLEHDQDFDLILCDLMMPQVSGTDIHRWLTARNPELAQRLVFITGGVFGPVAAQYVAQAGSLKIEKPFDSGEFKQVVSDRVRRAKSEPPTAGRDTKK